MINVSCLRTQHSDAGEARTQNPSVSSQALYHWATGLSAGGEIWTHDHIVTSPALYQLCYSALTKK